MFNTTSGYSTAASSSSGVQAGSGALAGSDMSTLPVDGLAGFVVEAMNTTTKALAGAAVEEVQRRFSTGADGGDGGQEGWEWAGVGLEWLRSLLGRREWTIPCVDVKVRL